MWLNIFFTRTIKLVTFKLVKYLPSFDSHKTKSVIIKHVSDITTNFVLKSHKLFKPLFILI